MFQYIISFDVFLGYDEKELRYLIVKGNLFGQACTIYAKDGKTIIAKVNSHLSDSFDDSNDHKISNIDL